MVMHSNERGECSPRTLVDRKWKRYDNAVDIVVRLHNPTDPSTEGTAPPRSAHVVGVKTGGSRVGGPELCV